MARKGKITNYFFGYITDEDIDLSTETAIGDGSTTGLLFDLEDGGADSFNVIDATAIGLDKEPYIKSTADGEEDHTGSKEDSIEASFTAIALTDTARATIRAYKGKRRYFWLLDMVTGFVIKAGLLKIDVSIDTTGNKNEVYTILGTEQGSSDELYESKTLTAYSGSAY